MQKLIIVENPDSWKFSLEEVEVITPAKYIFHILSFVFYAGIISLCTLQLIAGTYNPFK